MLSVDSSEIKTPTIVLQDLKEDLTVHLPEKSPPAPSGERREETILNIPQHAVLNKLYPQVQLANESLTRWGCYQSRVDPGKRTYPTLTFCSGEKGNTQLQPL